MNEPVRKSYLDLVKKNMAAAEMKHFITRLVYLGTYNGTDEHLQKNFEGVIKNLQNEYPEDTVTGLLLVYPQYFVHVIETSEELIFRHLGAIFRDGETSSDLGRVLPLPPRHHVHKRFFPRWLKTSAEPPQMLEKLEGTELAEIEKQLTNCFLKISTLCEYVSSNVHGNLRSIEEVLGNLRANDQQLLPESTLLEFLLSSQSPILRDLREYVNIAWDVPRPNLYNENIWPPVCDFMPRDVFVERASRRNLMLRRMTLRNATRDRQNQ